MSHSKTNTAEIVREEENTGIGEIIPWPDLNPPVGETSRQKPVRVKLGRKYLYYKGKKIPILHFQKAGYGKLLKLLVKEVEG